MSEWLCAMCGAAVAARERVGRRDSCPACDAELRSCRHCQFYDPTAYNACHEPQAERVLDKERANFCDYFAFAPGVRRAAVARDPLSTPDDARAKLDALFRKS
jgi:hypothetical protein